MNCNPPSEVDLTSLDNDSPIRKKRITHLQKGGEVLNTSIGGIQYGIPPETLKDSISLGLKVPQYYIIPQVNFDKVSGVNLMEFEFPVYYNFFIGKGKKTVIICDQKTMEDINIVFQETLLGPKEYKNIKQDIAEGYKAYPDFVKECKYFAKNPFNPKQVLTCDMFIDFKIYKENQVILQEGTNTIKIIKKFNHKIDIFDNDKKIRTFDKQIKIRQENFQSYKNISLDIFKTFDPPVFGVTMLGSSHGFDCGGSTSGFIIWINKRGIMIDPPPFSSKALRNKGIPPNLIEKIIITHCHADHDSGAFHKIIEAAQIEFLTSSIVLGSFLRKYSAISRLPLKELKKLFQYRIVKIGVPTYIFGSRFEFSYAFHSIPSLRFTVEFQGKRIYYSSDTFYDPVNLEKIYKQGIFSEERYKDLAVVDFDKYDLIFHEAGVPPIHTPISVLSKLSDKVKDKMYLYHVAEKAIPKESGLKRAKVGLSNTIYLIKESKQNQLSNFDLLCSMEILNYVPFRRMSEILGCIEEKKYKKGDRILTKGEKGVNFYIVKWGTVKIFNDPDGYENYWCKFYYRGDYFGESVLFGKNERLACADCETDVVLLEIKKEDFLFTFKYKEYKRTYFSMSPIQMITNLSSLRQKKIAEFIYKNKVINKMTEIQKSFLNMLLESCKVYKNQKMWVNGYDIPFCYFVQSAVFELQIFDRKGKVVREISNEMKQVEFESDFDGVDYIQAQETDLIGDFPHLLQNKKCTSSATCIKEGYILLLHKNRLLEFLQRFPGLYIILRDSYIIK